MKRCIWSDDCKLDLECEECDKYNDVGGYDEFGYISRESFRKDFFEYLEGVYKD